VRVLTRFPEKRTGVSLGGRGAISGGMHCEGGEGTRGSQSARQLAWTCWSPWCWLLTCEFRVSCVRSGVDVVGKRGSWSSRGLARHG
jgi:hypothetical protein